MLLGASHSFGWWRPGDIEVGADRYRYHRHQRAPGTAGRLMGDSEEPTQAPLCHGSAGRQSRQQCSGWAATRQSDGHFTKNWRNV